MKYILLFLLIIPVITFGKTTYPLEWCGENYELTVSTDRLLKSKVSWDPREEAPPLSFDTAYSNAKNWMTSHFPEQKFFLLIGSLNRAGIGEYRWVYKFYFRKGEKNLCQVKGLYKTDTMQICVLMDGTLITPIKVEPGN